MRLIYEIFGLSEAGVQGKPTAEPKSKLKRWPDPAERDDDEEEEVPEFGTDVPDEEPPPEFGSSEEEPEGDEPEEEPMTRFASKSEPPRRRSEEEVAGLRISGDPATLAQLREALDQLSASPRVDEDMADWLDECVRAIDQAGRRREPTVTLPKFEATPSLGDFDDDEGGPDYEEGED